MRKALPAILGIGLRALSRILGTGLRALPRVLGTGLLAFSLTAWGDSGATLLPSGRTLKKVVKENHFVTLRCKGTDLMLKSLSSKDEEIGTYPPASGKTQALAVGCRGTSVKVRCTAQSAGIQSLLLQARSSSLNYALLIKKGAFSCPSKMPDCLTDELVGFMADFGK